MMTQERIDYFLQLPKGEITDEEFSILVKRYFQCDKDNWCEFYVSNNIRSKKWDSKKVEEFWKLIRLHAIPIFKKKKNFNFQEFVFPIFEDEKPHSPANFWYSEEEKTFEYDVNFWFSVFMDNADFRAYHFLLEADFTLCEFNGIVKFFRTYFHKKAVFNGTVFIEDVIFQKTVFSDDVYFSTTYIFKKLYFKYLKFKALHLSSLNVNSGLHIRHWKQLLRINKGQCPTIIFEIVDFTREVKFSRFDISMIGFDNCSNLFEIHFDLCIWSRTISRGRMIFLKEDDYQNAENQYRQLKQNFTKIGNWELAGYAYVSEMEMRKKRYWKDKSYLIWLFYWFYDYFGGYTQDFVKPIKRLFFAFLFFTGIYFFIDYHLGNAFQRSIAASVPYIQIQKHVLFENEWLIIRNLQFVFSVVLLSFFVLALRKRFKL